MKFYKWRHSRQIRLPQALLAALWLFPVLAHAEASYLHELEAEAARTDNEQQTPAPAKANKPAWTAHQQSLSETIPQGLSKTQFEQRLKQSFFGSHLFYSKLNDASQQSVYEDYKKNNSINSIRESIKSHMKSE
jgi:hypothetical protein